MAEKIQSTIEVQADTKQALAKIRELNQAISTFNHAVNQQNADAMKTAKALEKQVLGTNFANNFNTQIIRMSSSVEQLSQKLDKGKVGFQEYRKFLDRENGMLEQIAQRRVKLMQSMQIGLTGQIRGGQRGALVTPKEFDNMSTATANLNAFGKQMDITAQKTILLNEAMRQGAIQLTNWGKNMQWAGRQLTVGLTLPITAFAAVSVTAFKEVEEQLIQIRRVYGDLETTDYEKALGEKQLLEAAEAWTRYGVSVSDALKVGAQVAATGAQGAEAVSQMNEAIRFATLGNFELADSQAAVIAMMSSMGIASEELRGEVDYLNAVENQTLLTMQDVADAVPRVGPVLKDMGGDVRDLTALLAAMKEGGVDASEGANALKSGLASLINPTKEAKDAFGDFGINLNDVVQGGAGDPVKMIQDLASQLQGLSELGQQRLIETLFGKYQFARWSALFDNINKAGSQAQETLELAGMSASDLAQIANSELAKIEASPLTQFNKNLEELKMVLVPIGEMVLKVFNPILDVLGNLLEFVGQNDIAKWIAGIGGAAIAIVGPITMIAGLFANFIGNIIQFRSFIRKKMTGETFMTELEIQGRLAAVALDEFGKEAQQNLSALSAQSTAVRDLATEYNLLAASVERAKIEISHTVNDPTRSRPGTDVAGQQASRYHYRRRFATGGTVPGSGSGDKVPAMLEPGEFVVSKSAAKKFRPTLDAMNAGTIEGMQGGGLIEESHVGAGKIVNISQLIDEENIRKSTRQMAKNILAIFGDIAVEVKHAMVLNLPKEINQALKTTIPGQGAPAGQLAAELTDAASRGEAGQLLVSRNRKLPRGLGEYEKQLVKAGLSQQEIAETMVKVNKEANVYAIELAKNVQLLSQSNNNMANDAILEEAHQKTLKENQQSLEHFSKAANALTNTASEVRLGLEGANTKIQEFIKTAPKGKTISDTVSRTGTRRRIEEVLDPNTGNVVGRAKYRQGRGQEEKLEAFRPEGTSAFIRSQKDPFPLSGFSRRMSQIPERITAPIRDWMNPQNRQEAIKALEKTVDETGKQTTEALRRATRSKSPSKDAEKVGLDFALGYAKGIESGQPQVVVASEHLAQASMKSLQVHGPLPTPIPAVVGPNRVNQAQQVAAARQQRMAEVQNYIQQNPVLPSPATAPRVRQAADIMQVNEQAAKEAAKAQSKVAVEATEAAGDLNKLSTSAEESTQQLNENVSGYGKFNKFLFGLDAISGALMFTDGKLGEFANKIFIASNALTAISMIPGVGKVAGKAGGALKSGAGSVIGKVAPKLAGLGAGAGAALASGPVLGVAAAAAAVAGGFYLLYRNMNKFDKALLDTSENIKAASEKFGFALNKPLLTGIGGGVQDSETVKGIKEFMDDNLKNQIKYINSIEDKKDRQATVDSIVAQYIAAGMPKEYAQELARQLAGATETSMSGFTSKIADIYDEEGKLRKDAGDELLKGAMGAFNYIEVKGSKIPKLSKRDISQEYEQAVARGFPGSQKQFEEQNLPQVVKERTNVSKQEMETVANSIFPTLESLGTLMQNGLISSEQYFDSFQKMKDVTDSYGGQLKGVTDKFVEMNPSLAALKDELNESGSSAQLMALQMAGVDVTPLTEALANGKIAVDDYSEFLSSKIFPLVEQVQTRQEELLVEPKDRAAKATAEIERLQGLQSGLEETIADAQDGIEGIDDKWQGELDTLDERQYKLDRANYSLDLQKDTLDEQIESQEKILDNIDKEIDKIEEARDKRIESINDTADAQIKGIERLQSVNERAQQEKTSFFDIGRALQAGDIAGAMTAQEEYTQQFGQTTYEDQIKSINDWKESSIDAINEEADAKIQVEKDKQEEIQNTIDSIQAQIDILDKQLEQNQKASAAISERTAVIEHQKKIEKEQYEQQIKAAQDAEKNNAKAIKDQQAILDTANKQITAIKDNGKAMIDSITAFQSKYGLSPEEVNKVLNGDVLTKYLQGTPQSLSYVIDGKPFTLEPVKKHEGGHIGKEVVKQPGLAHDEVPAVLQTGEYVLQRTAVNQIGKEALDKLNQGGSISTLHQGQLSNPAYERYHDGGMVPGAATFPLAIGALMSRRLNESAMQNYGLASAIVAGQQYQEVGDLSGISSELMGAVDWSRVSGGPGGGWHWPTPGYAQQTDDFGYIGHRRYSDGRPRRHAGWDIMAPTGSPVHAIRSGTIVNSAHSTSAAGNWMAIDHGGGLYTRYLHLLKPMRKVGDEVEGGQIIAQANASGTSVPHLHFEITRNRLTSEHADAFNPINWFKLKEPYNYHEGGIVGTNEVPAILEKGEFVIPKDGWQYGGQAMSMPTYSANSGMGNFSMPTYASSSPSVAPVAVGGGGGGGGGISSSYSNNASNNYTINVNVNGANSSANEIANTVYARINRTQRISRR